MRRTWTTLKFRFCDPNWVSQMYISEPRVRPPLELQFKIFLLPSTLPLSVSGSHTFGGLTFFLNSVWFAGIYVRSGIPKLFLVGSIMKVAKSKNLKDPVIYHVFRLSFLTSSITCSRYSLRSSSVSEE